MEKYLVLFFMLALHGAYDSLPVGVVFPLNTHILLSCNLYPSAL